MVSQGQFITFEGIEGCGKSLQAKLLHEEFTRRNLPCLLTREPGGTEFGMEVRQVVLASAGAPREPVSELLLYLADRYQHLREVVEPSLARGLHVISDRYHDATRVYQGIARGIGLERVGKLARVLGLRTPDLTVVVDIEVEVGLARARRRNSEEEESRWGRFEDEQLAFHEEVRQGYFKIAEEEPDRIRFVDGSGPPEAVAGRIIELLESRSFPGFASAPLLP